MHSPQRIILLIVCCAAAAAHAQEIPRTADGRPDLSGIWQIRNAARYNLEAHPASHGIAPGQSVVVGGAIPYQEQMRAQRDENFRNRAVADPLNKCFLPGTPRIMYLDHPFEITQGDEHIALTFEWTQVFRLIYTAGQETLYPGFPSWMGNSRGSWEGDTLIVEVSEFNDQTWFDAAGNFHSDQLRLVEEFRMTDPNTIEYQVTVTDEAVFTETWQIRMLLERRRDIDRILEYQCQAEFEEQNGDLERDELAWYPAEAPPGTVAFDRNAEENPASLEVPADIARRADGTPDISGYYETDAGGANYGFERMMDRISMPPSRGVITDPPDGLLPYQDWARAEAQDRSLPHRGYDDSTAHCIVAGVPRSNYVPAPFFILQGEEQITVLHERMSYRHLYMRPVDALPDHVRLWQGHTVARWVDDVLIAETTNLNGKSWLNEWGDLATHALTVVESWTPVSAEQLIYRATMYDPHAYTRPWTIELPMNRVASELLEVACLEQNNDLGHLRDVRDAWRAEQEAQ